jgi:hypothetical protein
MHALAIFERKPNGRQAKWCSHEPLPRNQAMTAQAQAFDWLQVQAFFPCLRAQAFDPWVQAQAFDPWVQAQAFGPWCRPQTTSAEILLHSIPIRQAVLLIGDGSIFDHLLLPRTRLDNLDAEVDVDPNFAPSAAAESRDERCQTTELGDGSLFALLLLLPHTRLDNLDAEVDGFPNVAPSVA